MPRAVASAMGIMSMPAPCRIAPSNCGATLKIPSGSCVRTTIAWAVATNSLRRPADVSSAITTSPKPASRCMAASPMAWVSRMRGTSSANLSVRRFGARQRVPGCGTCTLRRNLIRHSRRNAFLRIGKKHAKVGVDSLQMLAENMLTLLGIAFQNRFVELLVLRVRTQVLTWVGEVNFPPLARHQIEHVDEAQKHIVLCCSNDRLMKFRIDFGQRLTFF